MITDPVDLDPMYTQVRAFLLLVVPTTSPLWEVIQGLDNRVGQPAGNHVVMTALFQRRLRTNQVTDDGVDQEAAYEMGVEVTMQLDVYGDKTVPSVAAAISTMWRSDLACDALAPACQPLECDQGRQVPCVTGEDQYLLRWTLTATLQYNPVTTAPQQSATALEVGLINVDVSYPP